MGKKYQTIIFLDGEEGRVATDKLYNVESTTSHGVTEESFYACLEYLLQWDDDHEGPFEYTEPWGANDQVLSDDADPELCPTDLVLSANLGLGYVALTRIIKES